MAWGKLKVFVCFSFSSPSETVTYPTPVDSSRARSSRIFQKTFLNKQYLSPSPGKNITSKNRRPYEVRRSPLLKKTLVPMTTAATASIRKRKRASVSCVNSLDLLSSTNYEIYVQCLPSCLRKFSCSILNQRIYLYLKENHT